VREAYIFTRTTGPWDSQKHRRLIRGAAAQVGGSRLPAPDSRLLAPEF
jgi:hypothetical protein